MVGEFPIRPSGQNPSQTKFSSSKEKGRRLESITARLQPSAHLLCSTSCLTKDNIYLCAICRKHSVVPGTSLQLEDDQFTDQDFSEQSLKRKQSQNGGINCSTSYSIQGLTASTSTVHPLTATSLISVLQSKKLATVFNTNQKYCNPPVINTDIDFTEVPAQFPTGSSFTSSVDEELSLLNSENPSVASSPSVSGFANSNRESPMNEIQGSDPDDSRPSSSRRKDNGSKSRSITVKENKRPAPRQSAMKTRSGGKPSGVSYAHLGKLNSDRRKPNVKGKGKSNQPRSRKPRNNRLSYLQTIAMNARRESEEVDPDEPKTRQLDDNDYIRTAIVSRLDNVYVCTAPMCLICGGIGRDSEATMMSCMSCCQTYHSYCVNMHDKLNKAMIKRGWRCLQCTVCEACGDGADESNLLLCDECDVAFHTYCLEPKLDRIPTGSWRCHWCATCRRCNKQVQAGLDLQQSDGLCESCHSLKRCPKCCRRYQSGELMIKCQHCEKWLHGACEDLLTEEQLETAYENAFRCSLCRPRANAEFQELISQSVIIDNVMVNKTALEMLKCGRSGSSVGLGDITGSFRSQSLDQNVDNDDYPMDDNEFSGSRGRGRISGPGRRPPKLGIGGFVVKNRNRVMQSIEEEQAAAEKEEQEEKANLTGKQRRRPRKPRRHQLEDAYPANIQQAFWGIDGVDGKTVVEMHITEPVLEDSQQYVKEHKKVSQVFELSDEAADKLRSLQADDMLGDVLGDNLDIDNIENFDFSEFFGDDEDFDDDFTNDTTQDQTMDNNEVEQEPRKIELMSDRHRMESQRTQSHHGTEREERGNQSSERWAEDEPLGDKATKAAVLYANMEYPQLKTEYPNWVDRAKQIHRIWRNLAAERRLEYVQKARDNRANRARVPKRRFATKPSQPRPESANPGPSSANSNAEHVEEQKVNKPPESNGNHQPQNPPQNFVHMNGTTMNNPNHQNIGLAPQLPNPQPGPSQVIVHHYNQPQAAPPAIISDSRTNGGVLVRDIGPANQGTVNTRREVTSEIAERFLTLSKKQNELKQRHEELDVIIAQCRRSKKSLTAKKRTLNKNCELDANGERIIHELSEIDQAKFDEATRKMQDCSKNIELVKKEEKEIKSRLDDLETQYGIISVTAVPTDSIVYNQPGNPVVAIRGSPAIGNGQPLIIRAPSETRSPVSLGNSPRINFATRNIPPAYPAPNVFISTNGTLQRTDSISSLPESGTPPVRSGSSMSNDFNSQQKIPRGRKRRKPDAIRVRSAFLGGIPFAAMKDDNERQAYEVLDGILSDLAGMETNTMEPDVRRLLNTHAPLDNHSYSVSPTLEVPKKKKRTMAKKGPALNDSCELENFIDKIHATLSACPPIPAAALNPLPSYDPIAYIAPGTTKLPDNGVDVMVEGNQFGLVSLTFMPDFYEQFVDYCKPNPPKPDLPISCAELYSTIHFDVLFTEPESPKEQESEKIFTEHDNEPYYDLHFNNEVPRDDFDQLNIDRIKEREGIEPQISISFRYAESDSFFCDPPKTAWENIPIYDDEIEIDLVVDYPEGMQTDDVITQIANILKPEGNMNEEKDIVLETASLSSPIPNSCPDLEDDIPECCGCHTPLIDADYYEHEIEGSFSERYCSEQCFIEHENQDECFEPKVEEQLTVDTTEKEVVPPLPSPDENEEDIDLNAADKLVLLESLRQSRELEYTVAELPQPVEATVEVTPGGTRTFKFRGQGWMACTDKLIYSFKTPPEDNKIAIKDHCGNWMQLVNKDTRKCAFCNEMGDGLPSMTGRLLNVDANEWVHVNCAIWSAEVHESECGGLNNVQNAIKQARLTKCLVCLRPGASLKCFKLECSNSWYHLPCALRHACKFMKDMTMVCANHGVNINPDVRIEELDALRRIYIEREENGLLSKIFNNSFSCEMMMRIGSLVFYHIGQLLPDQMKSFHNSNFIFPVGYKVVRIFWHPKDVERRIGFECTIEDNNNVPQFRVAFEDKEIRESSPNAAWTRILNALQQTREKNGNVLRFFANQLNGETLFGFHEIPITKMIESLPGIDQLHTYEFKHGGAPLMEVPLAINPTGCARTEPCFRTLIKSKKTLASPLKHEERPASSQSFTSSKRRRRKPVNELANHYDQDTLRLLKASGISEEMLVSGLPRYETNSGNNAQIYSRYKQMKAEWKSYVTLGRSRIAGFGLFAKRDLCMNQMIIEYCGEIIRSEICEIREKQYAQKNTGIYMFRIDSEYVIDATRAGNMARYINHSCDPNCFTQIVNVDNTKKIVIFANRPIKAGEELCYDYQFEFEDSKDKIPYVHVFFRFPIYHVFILRSIPKLHFCRSLSERLHNLPLFLLLNFTQDHNLTHNFEIFLSQIKKELPRKIFLKEKKT
uniref:Histone-lysine N-methyltransferase n=1 Tax=Panagrolaimus sp. JU765 TaxID=591449 RepID=A0AC34REB7_9BILA